MNIEGLLQDLTDPDEQTRKRAILHLGQALEMRAVPALMQVCKGDESLEVRFYAKKVLLRYREAIVEEQERRATAAVPAAAPHSSSSSPPSPSSSPAAPPSPGVGAEAERNFAELSSEDPTLRIKAIMALVQLRAPETVQRLRSLNDREDNPRVRAALVLALGLLGGADEVPVVRKCLTEKDPRVRANALEALKMLGGVAAVSDIAALLRDPDRRVKDLALETLQKFPVPALLEQLRAMLAVADAKVRDTAAYAILRLESPQTLPLVIGALSDEEISIRLKARNALVVLAQNGCKEAFDALSRHAGDRAAPEKFMTMSVIERRPQLDGLADPRPRERLEAIRAIVEAREVERVPALLQALLREKDKFVRASLVLALGRLEAREAVATLKIFLEDADPRIRANAVEALGFIGGAEVFPLLIPLLEDANNRVRANAVVGLGRCPYIQLDMPLRQMARSSEVLMRRSCIHAILELRRPDLVPLLVELLRDREQVVRDRAHDALKVLAGEGLAAAAEALSATGVS